jgi:hypothetical protein
MTSDGFRIYYKIDAREPLLPKWVQEHINSLRRSIRTLQEQFDQDVSDADTFLENSYEVPREALGKGVRIVFRVPDEGRRWPEEFEVKIHNGKLQVSANSQLLIKQAVSNRLEIGIE